MCNRWRSWSWRVCGGVECCVLCDLWVLFAVEGGEGVFDVVGREGVWWMLLLFVEIEDVVLCLK